jgi:hypothetical protein
LTTLLEALQRIIATFVPLVAVVACSVTPALAEGTSPWWHLSSIDRPTDLHNLPRASEVQQLAAASGAVFELTVGGTSIGAFEAEPRPYDGAFKPATAAELQVALEGVYGAGNVLVTGGPGGSGTPLTITSVGADADKPVEPLEVSVALPSANSATATVLTAGAATETAGGEIIVTATNVGDATVDGEKNPVDISDVLPPGLRATSIAASVPEGQFQLQVPLACALESGSRGSCKLEGTYVKKGGDGLANETLPLVVPPYDSITMTMAVVVEGAETGAENGVSISGGGAPPAQAEHPIVVGTAPAPYGVEGYELTAEEPGGAPDRQAGSHPFQLTTTFALNTSAGNATAADVPALAKDLVFKLPPGLVGDPSATAKCTLAAFYAIPSTCPSASIIGVGQATVAEPRGKTTLSIAVPMYNMEPSPGEAARFAFQPGGVAVFLDATVRSGEDYGVTVRVENISQILTFSSSQVTFWGVPGLPSHDISRGEGCLLETRGVTIEELEREGLSPCKPFEEKNPPAMLTMPTACTGPLQSTLESDSWQRPGEYTPPVGEPLPALDGCNRLPFTPSIEAAPDLAEASKPSGLTVDVHVPQEETLNVGGIGEASPKDIVVALPAGVQLNPSAADGLQACSQAQVGYTGSRELNQVSEPGVLTAQFQPEVYDPVSEKNELTLCPSSSKIATATIRTPLLPNALEGAVYLAAPQNFSVLSGAPKENPFESLVAMYLVVRDPVSGVIVKLAGSVSLSPATGQITATFAQSPQAPFEDAELKFFGGERAPLATPALCRRAGESEYRTLASFTPWSAAPGEAPSESASEFAITSGPGGGPCPNPVGDQSPSALPFAASLHSSSSNINAGGFTPLTTTLSRPDGSQSLQSVALHYPPGLSGLLSGVKLCGEAQANAGTCGAESEIGETIVSVGVGGDPFSVTGGKVYITEHYDGAPFGLSIVNPAKAGPFDLQEGQPVVVRAKIEVNPLTAALTVTTNSQAEGHAIPTVIDGIPLQIQHVNVLIDRPGFTFNPTDCNPMKITGALDSAEGASSPVEVPFQVTNCAALAFAPKFAVSTSGKTSRADGASLSVKLTYPNTPFGSQANIKQVKVELPKALPSRLTTLQKACTAAQFNTNPAGCPAASLIGHAKAITPLIPVPLEGPAYFVSNGGEAFPNLIVVLQGYGVTIDLVGETFISKAGITSSTFKTVPDAPVGSFELNLPTGPYSALTGLGNLCKQKLVMPTEFVGQNGALINTDTKIEVTGCSKAKKTKAKKAAHKKKAKGKRHGKGKGKGDGRRG